MFCRKTNEKQSSIQEEKEKVEVEVEDENDIDADEERRSRRRRRKRGEFVNILAINHQPNMTKPYKPLMAYNIENPLDPQSLKRYILATEKMEQIVEYFAKKTQQKPEEIRKQVKRILDEIGLDRNLAIIRWCGIAITYISTRITRGIYIHEEHIERLKRNLGSHPVLYLPSHRSYMDFILMSYVFFHYDIEIPGITAGMGRNPYIYLNPSIWIHSSILIDFSLRDFPCFFPGFFLAFFPCFFPVFFLFFSPVFLYRFSWNVWNWEYAP